MNQVNDEQQFSSLPFTQCESDTRLIEWRVRTAYRHRWRRRIEGRLGGDWTGCSVLVDVLEFVTRVSVGVSVGDRAQTRWRVGRHAAFERLGGIAGGGVRVGWIRRCSGCGIAIDEGLQFEVRVGSDWRRFACVIRVHVRGWELSGGRLGELMNTR